MLLFDLLFSETQDYVADRYASQEGTIFVKRATLSCRHAFSALPQKDTIYLEQLSHR
jgi:hypothetical protein